jgi:hypothetical protein
MVVAVVGEWGGCCRQGEQGAEEIVGGVHFWAWVDVVVVLGCCFEKIEWQLPS